MEPADATTGVELCNGGPSAISGGAGETAGGSSTATVTDPRSLLPAGFNGAAGSNGVADRAGRMSATSLSAPAVLARSTSRCSRASARRAAARFTGMSAASSSPTRRRVPQRPGRAPAPEIGRSPEDAPAAREDPLQYLRLDRPDNQPSPRRPRRDARHPSCSRGHRRAGLRRPRRDSRPSRRSLPLGQLVPPSRFPER